MILSSLQLDFFHAEGYLAVEQVFDSAVLDRASEEITQQIDRLAEPLVGSGELSRAYRELPFEQRLTAITRETPKVHEGLRGASISGPGLFGLLTHPRLLDVAEAICGSELVASSTYRIRPKVPNYAAGCIPWHQDSAFFEPYCDQSLIITCWVPLVDATRERGCLWVLPRAHKNGVYKHKVLHERAKIEIQPEDLPHAEPVCVPVPRGGLLVITNKTPHTSFNNNSDVIRWSIDVRYQSAGLPTNAIAPATGEKLFRPASEEIPAACYPPELDFLVRSKLRPGDVCADAERFQNLRRAHQPVAMTDRWNWANR